MTPLSIIFTLPAQEDLNDLWDSRLLRGRDQAQKALDMMLARMADLAEFPEMGRQRDDLKKQLRSLPCLDRIVFYRVEANTLLILRVLHERRDALSQDFDL